MKIKSIEVEGFWAYREAQRIDISGIPLIVGVGDNGAGKSAILVSAIMVAFYGKFPSKTIEESITTGAAQGRVSVEFELAGAVYRVARIHPRTGSPTGQVLVQDPTQKTGWRSLLHGKGITETTEYITGLLGMDYKTATMTWVAEQGQYGKFATAQPVERFNLLSSIFGLDVYGPKAAAANARFKEADAAVTRIDGRIAELTETTSGPTGDPENDSEEPDTVRTLAEDQLNWKAASLDEEIDRVTVAIADLSAGDPARKTLEARQAYELVLNARLAENSAAVGSHNRATTAIASARNRGAALRNAADARFNADVNAAKSRSAQEKENAAARRRDALATLTLIAAAQRDLPELVDTVTAHRDAAVESRRAADELSAEIAANTTSYGRLKADWAAHKVSIDDAQARIATLTRSAEDSDHAECFSCGQHLSTADAVALIDSQRRDIEALTAKQVTARTGAIAAKDAAAAAQAARDALLADALSHDTAANTTAVAVTRAETLIGSKTACEAAEAAATAAVTAAGREEAVALQRATAEHTGVVQAANAEESDAVTTAEADIRSASPIIQRTAEPSEPESKLAEALRAAEVLVAGEVAEVEERRAVLDEERAGLRREASVYAAEKARRDEIASLRAEQAERLVAITRERGVAVMDRTLHATLLKAYSPGGIPAMVLAGVIEQLNEAVNVALARLSRGELAISLRTTRETTKGAIENKVSVYVETPTGVRAYETLSGGQRFRVDLAIRTGLAATVARGTGTPIETFILDEGWGTLDEKGIVATIDTVFRLSEETNVITVSHIDAVRDAFPARVEVSMSGGTSVAQVVVG